MTNYIHLADLIVPDDRHRTEFPESYIEELAESIRDNGLIHPIALRDDGLTLVAGECRTRAMTLLHERGIQFEHAGEPVPEFKLPFTRMGEMDTLARKCAELEENLRRRNLSWQDEARAQAELHTLRKAQDPGWTMKQTSAEILGVPPSKLQTTDTRILREAQALTERMNDPEIAKAKTRGDALKLLRKRSEAVLTEALADVTRTEANDTPHTFYMDDCRRALARLPDGHYDVILTDPPYGMGADRFGDQADGVHRYDDSAESMFALMTEVIPQLFRVAKPEAHLYMFCDHEHFPWLKQRLAEAGWVTWRTPLIWAKRTGMLPRPDHGPRRTYECIIYALKGQRPVRRAGALDVIDIPQESTLEHAAQKPRDLYRELLDRSAYPGDSVLDPFAGRGTIFLAASALGLRATGIELNPEMAARCELASRGMAQDTTDEDDN